VLFYIYQLKASLVYQHNNGKFVLRQIEDLTMRGRLHTEDQNNNKRLNEPHVKTLYTSYAVDVRDTKGKQALF